MVPLAIVMFAFPASPVNVADPENSAVTLVVSSNERFADGVKCKSVT